jgi:hypothetical protein
MVVAKRQLTPPPVLRSWRILLERLLNAKPAAVAATNGTAVRITLGLAQQTIGVNQWRCSALVCGGASAAVA